MTAFVDQWKQQPETGRLYSIADQEDLKPIDSRLNATSLELRGVNRTIDEYCDSLHNLGSIIKNWHNIN